MSNDLTKRIVHRAVGMAVVQGAAMYCLDPTIFTERTSRKTYGIGAASLSRPQDPERFRFFSVENGCEYTDNFRVYVRNGEQVATDSRIVHSFRPHFANQTEARIPVLSTTKKDPKYAREVGVIEEGSFMIQMPDTSPGRERSFDVTMRFGTTSIEVTAEGRNFDSGEPTTATVTFVRSCLGRGDT
jgi:hypothetical protein